MTSFHIKSNCLLISGPVFVSLHYSAEIPYRFSSFSLCSPQSNPNHPDPKSSRAGCKSHLSISCWQVTRSATRSASYLPLPRKCLRFVCSALFSFFRPLLDPPIALAFAHPCRCIFLFSSSLTCITPYSAIFPSSLLSSLSPLLSSPLLFTIHFTSLYLLFLSSVSNKQTNKSSDPLAASDPTPFSPAIFLRSFALTPTPSPARDTPSFPL